MKNIILPLLFLLIACTPEPKTIIAPWTPYDESPEIAENADHESRRLRYKLIQSKNLDRNEIWKNVADQIKYFSEEDYQRLKPLIMEQVDLAFQVEQSVGHVESMQRVRAKNEAGEGLATEKVVGPIVSGLRLVAAHQRDPASEVL